MPSEVTIIIAPETLGEGKRLFDGSVNLRNLSNSEYASPPINAGSGRPSGDRLSIR